MRISFSAVDQYAGCSLQYMFQRRLHLPVRTTGLALIAGSCGHKALEELDNSIESPTKLMPKSEMLEIFDNNWTSSRLENDINITDADFDEQGSIIKTLLSLYYDKYYGTEWFNPSIATEFWFEVPLIDLQTGEVLLEDHILIGKIDRINEFNNMLLVTDHKFTKYKYSQEKVDESNQLTFYLYVLEYLISQNAITNFNNLPLGGCFSALYKQKNPFVNIHTTIRKYKDIKRLSGIIQTAVKGIQKDIYIPADGSMKCTYCDYKEACRLWGTEDDWEEIYLKNIRKTKDGK